MTLRRRGLRAHLLLCRLDRSGPVRIKVIPHFDTTERGPFATRAPSQPSPIGLSEVRLLRRHQDFLHIADLYLLDGTPLLDIEPFAPHIDVFDVGRAGGPAGMSDTRPEIASSRVDPSGQATTRPRFTTAATTSVPSR